MPRGAVVGSRQPLAAAGQLFRTRLEAGSGADGAILRPHLDVERNAGTLPAQPDRRSTKPCSDRRRVDVSVPGTLQQRQRRQGLYRWSIAALLSVRPFVTS